MLQLARAHTPKRNINNLSQLSLRWNAVFLVLLFFGALLIIIPMALVVIVSFSTTDSIAYRGFSLIPTGWTLQAYEYLFKTGDQLLQSYLITIFYTVVGTVLSLMLMSTFAYVISQRTFVMRRPLTWFLFFTMLFSGGLVPSYILNVRYLNIGDTVWVFLLGGLVNAYYVIILRTFIKTSIPDALMESARIDGAGHFTIFLRIVLPLFKAGLATVMLFNVVSRWNDWFTGLLYINTAKLVPLQTMLIKLQAQMDFLKQNAQIAGTPDGIKLLQSMPDQNLRMACTLVVILPILFAYPYFQRYFINGLTIGSIKE